MNYKFSEIAEITGGQWLNKGDNQAIQNVIYDTRKSSFASKSVFFAFKGAVNDGHNYIEEAYLQGVRNFIVSKKVNVKKLKDSNVLLVTSALLALQKLAKAHREKINIPIIAITGSNGKTIVKEWLGKALGKQYKVSKSPKSYNSQIGVALSLLQIEKDDHFAIIEAGISQAHEMKFLEKMIKPQIGIFTNLGDAHNQGFSSKQQKLKEKLLLFKNAQSLIYCGDQKYVKEEIQKSFKGECFEWSQNQSSLITYKSEQLNNSTALKIKFKNQESTITTSFRSHEFIENLLHVISCLLYLKFDLEKIQELVSDFDQIKNRLEIRDGINQNLLINDSYSLDMSSLQLALEFQDLHASGMEKILVVSDFDHQVDKLSIYAELKSLIQEKKIKQAFIIGVDPRYHELLTSDNIQFYTSGQELMDQALWDKLKDSCILIKGARRFRLENLFLKLSKKVHQTILETNFSALDQNLNVYKTFLKEETKIMAVIKADAYGSGSEQIAQYLEKKKIDYLAVAIVDEAVTIRMASPDIPIMVFNVEESQLDLLWENNLEPEIYSLHLLDKIIGKANEIQKPLNIHIKLDTGMKRLGFEEEELRALTAQLNSCEFIKVRSVFSHLAASESENHDAFTKQQISDFDAFASFIQNEIKYNVLKHILNTGGIIRHSDHQYDMVRIGLGLYGIDETGLIANKLTKVHSLKAKILQIKTLNPGQTTGYSRAGLANNEKNIAIVGIGYADGLMRLSGNGNFRMKIHEYLCPTIGNICMDVCMLDITSVPNVLVGDEVVIFDNELPIETLANACQTISYEVISRISPRVKRIYTYN